MACEARYRIIDHGESFEMRELRREIIFFDNELFKDVYFYFAFYKPLLYL